MGKIIFNGTFTDEIRREFRRRRTEYGLSYHRLAELFNTSWLSVRNWEIGKSKSCHSLLVSKVSQFLNGELAIEAKLATRKFARAKRRPHPCNLRFTQHLLHKIRDTYNACSDSEAIRNAMLERILKESKETLRQFINTLNA